MTDEQARQLAAGGELAELMVAGVLLLLSKKR
jgi:hypothetical protein